MMNIGDKVLMNEIKWNTIQRGSKAKISSETFQENSYVGRTAWSPSSQASVPALNPSPQTVDPDRDRSGLNLNCSSSFSN